MVKLWRPDARVILPDDLVKGYVGRLAEQIHAAISQHGRENVVVVGIGKGGPALSGLVAAEVSARYHGTRPLLAQMEVYGALGDIPPALGEMRLPSPGFAFDGKHVYLLDTAHNTGATLAAVMEHFTHESNPANVHFNALNGNTLIPAALPDFGHAFAWRALSPTLDARLTYQSGKASFPELVAVPGQNCRR